MLITSHYALKLSIPDGPTTCCIAGNYVSFAHSSFSFPWSQAEEDGVAAVEYIAGKQGHVDYNTVPGIVYTHPEVASVGKTEDQCKAEGIAVKVTLVLFYCVDFDFAQWREHMLHHPCSSVQHHLATVCGNCGCAVRSMDIRWCYCSHTRTILGTA